MPVERKPLQPAAAPSRAASLGLAAATTVVILLVAELGLRLLAPQPVFMFSPGPYESEGVGRFRLAPGYRGEVTNRTEFRNAIRVNSFGIRGPAPASGSDGVLRILAIGDSFTFGVGVEEDETFVARLAADLGPPVEGLNGGLPGIGVPRAVGWLEPHGLALEPDLVLLAVFVGNDLADAAAGRREGVEDGQIVLPESVRGLRRWLYYNSHLFALVKRATSRATLQPLRDLLGLGEPWMLSNLRVEMALYERRPEPRLAEGERRTAAALDRLVALGRQHGFRVAAMLIPSELQVDPERWRTALDLLGLDEALYSQERPTAFFLDLLAERAIPTLDLRPAFAAAQAGGERFYYRQDRHWTPAGHAFAAHELERFLAAHNLIDGTSESPPAAAAPAGAELG